MNTNLRTFFSTIIGTGLVLFTIVTSVANGFSPDSAALGISLLTIYGLVQIGMVSNTTAPGLRRRPAIAVVAANPEPAPRSVAAMPTRIASRPVTARKSRETAIAA